MYTYRIPGTAIPQGSKTVTRTGIMFDANKNLKAWRKHSTHTLKLQHELNTPLEGALSCSITFYFTRPKTVKREHPSVKPDIDKLGRAILDSLTQAGVIKDDALICDLNLNKQYTAYEPHVNIWLWAI